MSSPESMDAIERLTKDYADARTVRVERVAALHTEIEAAIRRRLPGLKSAVAKEAEAEALVRARLELHPDLFAKPRTQVFHGIKVGYQKGKGGISWEDDAQVVRLIRKHLADQADVLIKVEETPIKSVLDNLTVDELKRIGCQVSEAGDRVLVKPADTTADKLFKALRKGIKLEGLED
jgi:hypothetical protein